MAFVPKVHNREVPVANHPVAARAQQETHGRHLRSLHEMSPRVDTRWGGSWNGVRDLKQPVYPHVRANLKRAQIQDERFAEIELENTVLLAKLSKILRRSRNPTKGTRDWTGGLRLTPNQVPVIDHWISADTTAFGAAVEPSSLNLSQRRKERERIEVENRALVARLQTCKPTYDKAKDLKDAREREDWLQSHSMPRPLSPVPPLASSSGVYSAGGSSRPTSGIDGPVMFGGNSPSLSMTASAPIPRAGKLKPLARGPGASSGKLAKGGKVASGVDQAVLSVLDLLSTHMRGASSSLGEMRVARDSLMESVYPLSDALYHVNVIDAGGVKCELVCSKATLEAYLRSPSPALLVLAHGGMFVTGSPRAGRHLAARLSDLVGIPVVTPALRLAPEHPFPAALDDLKAAYAHLTSHAVGGASVPAAKVAIFAESSGGALTLGMLTRQGQLASSAVAEPAAIVLASPWLDLTCSSNSYVSNEGRDPVMQRKRLLGIARAYLADGPVAAEDPLVSPILGNSPSLLGLPPTLVQVGSAEVLLDESLEFERLAKDVGVDIRVQKYDGVLHAWHTFFPLMPKAVTALEQAAAFLCEGLGIPKPTTAAESAARPGAAAASSSSAAPSAPPAMDAEQELAAIKLQAMQRGRKARKTLPPAKIKSQPSTTVNYAEQMTDEQREQELAAIKLQAMQRGKRARGSVKSGQTAALTYGESAIQDKKALGRRKSEIKEQAKGYCEAHGRGPPNYKELSQAERDAADQEMAAVRMQAIMRGKKERGEGGAVAKKRKAKASDAVASEAGWNEGSIRAGFTTGDDRNNAIRGGMASSEQDIAAARVQAMQRKRQAQKERQALIAEREAAATKLAAARRGMEARRQVKAQVQQEQEEQFRAAATVQTAMRGKAARAELKATMAARGDAATKVAAARRGQQARRQVADLKVEGVAVQ